MADEARAASGVRALAHPDSGLGLRAGEVRIVEHDERWSELFDALAADVRRALASMSDRLDVQHIGSTAVSGLAAKPVLDVAIGLPAPIDAERVRGALTAIGIDYVDDLGMFGGLLFTIGLPDGAVSAHMHVVDIDDFQWRWYLAFRDELRRDHALAEQYESRKRQAAADNPANRPGYLEAKSEWVLSTVMRIDESG